MGHNYLALLNRAIEKGLKMRPGVFNCQVYHEKNCLIWREGYCNCSPIIEIYDGQDGKIEIYGDGNFKSVKNDS